MHLKLQNAIGIVLETHGDAAFSVFWEYLIQTKFETVHGKINTMTSAPSPKTHRRQVQ